MKALIVLLLIFSALNISNAQLATDFNCKDCGGTNHELFTELDAGKIVVLCWVMPCSSCLGPSLTTYNVVESYKTTYPDKVFMYLCDDYANTVCTSLNSWATGNNMANSIRFSNTAIKMSDYGTAGMPKIVVLGSTAHKVYYNINNSVNITDLQNAIETAISETSTEIIENQNDDFIINIFPNPSNSVSYLNVNLKTASKTEISVFNQTGQKITEIYNGELAAGKNSFEMNTSEFESGIYFVNVKYTDNYKTIKLVVTK
jgi:hypothetical protein